MGTALQTTDTLLTPISDSLEAAADAYLLARMEQQWIPGATVLVMKGDSVVLLKGYGVSDQEAGTPVDPTATRFYIASTAKLMTTLAVMRLVDRGVLDLDADVNTYLTRFQVPTNFGAPITLRDLLTHTAGFDDRNIEYAARTPADVEPLAEHLARRLPPRIRPTATHISYSNYGFALAGHIIEAVTNVSFTDFVEQEIFGTLHMRRSSYVPLDAEESRSLAQAYRWTGEAVPLGYSQGLPAGGAVTTAADMTHLLRALLGQSTSETLLSPTARHEMLSQQFTHDERLPGRGLGVWEHWKNGQHGFMIAGAAYAYASALYVLPGEDLAVFIGINRQEPLVALGFIDAVLDHYFPLPPLVPLSPPDAEARERLTPLLGTYRWLRSSERTLEKLVSLGLQFPVTMTEEGYLAIEMPAAGVQTYGEVAPGLYRNTASDTYLSFAFDAKGKATHAYHNGILTMPVAFVRVPWYEVRSIQMSMFFGAVLVFLGVVLAWPLQVWRQRRRPPTIAGQQLKPMHRWGLGLSLSQLVLAAALLAAFANYQELVFGMPFYVPPVLLLSFVGMACTVGLGWHVVQAWRCQQGTVVGKLCYSIVVLAGVAILVFWGIHNVLGFRY